MRTVKLFALPYFERKQKARAPLLALKPNCLHKTTFMYLQKFFLETQLFLNQNKIKKGRCITV